MEKFNIKELLVVPNLARSLGFGGLIGTLVMYLICLHYPELTTAKISLSYALTFGGAIGFSAHRLFDAILVQTFFKPTHKFISYYGTVAQLQIQRRVNWIDDATFTQFKSELDREYFLGIKIGTRRQIRSGSSLPRLNP